MENKCSLLYPQGPVRFNALCNILDVLVFYNDELSDNQFLALIVCLFSTFADVFHIFHLQFHDMPCIGDKGPTWCGLLTFAAAIFYEF